MKICRRCLVSKPEDQFHADKAMPDGRKYKCKDCVKELFAAYYQATKETRTAYNHSPEHLAAMERFQSAHPEHKKEYYQRSKDRTRDRRKELYQKYWKANPWKSKTAWMKFQQAHPERAKEIQRNASLRTRAKYPEKRKAQTAVAHAVASGKLRKRPCERCGNLKVQAHHEDYSKPLDVRWLCHRCHQFVEGRLKYWSPPESRSE